MKLVQIKLDLKFLIELTFVATLLCLLSSGSVDCSRVARLKTVNRNRTTTTTTGNEVAQSSPLSSGISGDSGSLNLFDQTTRPPKAKKDSHGGRNRTNSLSNKSHKKQHRISNRNTKRTMKHTTKANELYEELPINAGVEVINVTAKVGETVILTCAVNSSFGANPGVVWMQGKLGNVLTLNTNRITLDPRFDIIQHAIVQQPKKSSSSDANLASSPASPPLGLYDDYTVNSLESYEPPPSQVVVAKQPLQNEISYYNLRIENVQLYDENEYACETSLTKRNDDTPNLHSLMFLSITRKLYFFPICFLSTIKVQFFFVVVI
jgi:hypothetical protein